MSSYTPTFGADSRISRVALLLGVFALIAAHRRLMSAMRPSPVQFTLITTVMVSSILAKSR